LFSKLNLKAVDIVFVDDSERSLEGAEEIGYISVLYTNNKTLKFDLSRILDTKF